MIKQGDIYTVKFNKQGIGRHYVVILSNNISNEKSPNVIGAIITTRLSEEKLPTHHATMIEHEGIEFNGIVLTEMTRTFEKVNLVEKVSSYCESELNEILEKHRINFYTDIDLQVGVV